MNKGSRAVVSQGHFVFDSVQTAKTMNKVSTDLLEVGGQSIVSTWYRGPNDTELIFWTDRKSIVIKQQVSMNGEVAEWNVADGLRTGVIVEEEANGSVYPPQEKLVEVPASESLRYDVVPQSFIVQWASELIEHSTHLEPYIQDQLKRNFASKTKTDLDRLVNLQKKNFWQRVLSKTRLFKS